MNASGTDVTVIRFDRYFRTQRKDIDERMRTAPGDRAAHERHSDTGNLVQSGIGGWQVHWPGGEKGRKGGSLVLTVGDAGGMGLGQAADLALELARG